MHEWALAEGVIATALKAAEEAGLSEIAAINIRMGELQQIDIEVFEFALREISRSKGPVTAKAKMELEEEIAVLKCRVCEHEWDFSDAIKGLNAEERESIHFIPEIAHVYITCSMCKSPDFEFVKGRGVRLDSIKGE